MEQKKELKEAIKKRVIDFMAKQITRKESFVDLRNEIIEEMLLEEVKSKPKNLSKEALDSILRLKTEAEKTTTKKNFDKERVEEIKTGGIPKNLIDAYNNIYSKSNNEESFDEILKQLVGEKYVYKPDFFKTYLASCYYTTAQKELFRESVLKKIMENNYEATIVKSSFNNKISRVVYQASYEDKKVTPYQPFKINILTNKLEQTNNLVIDTACFTCNGVVMMNEDIGIETITKIINYIENKVYNQEKEVAAEQTEVTTEQKENIIEKTEVVNEQANVTEPVLQEENKGDAENLSKE